MEWQLLEESRLPPARFRLEQTPKVRPSLSVRNHPSIHPSKEESLRTTVPVHRIEGRVMSGRGRKQTQGSEGAVRETSLGSHSQRTQFLQFLRSFLNTEAESRKKSRQAKRGHGKNLQNSMENPKAGRWKRKDRPCGICFSEQQGTEIKVSPSAVRISAHPPTEWSVSHPSAAVDLHSH